MTRATLGLRTLWDFARPHTIIGTVLAVCALYVLAAASAQRTDFALWAIVLAASVAVNVYVVGLNQITDVDIDRISKPYLPLAAGSMRRTTAIALVTSAGVIALGVAGLQGRYLFTAIAVIFVIGTLYSLPPLRLKRFPVLAAASIVIARAVVGNIGVYLTYSSALTGHAALTSAVLLLVGFLVGYAVVIAVMKDIPDVDGDREHGVATFVLSIGPARTLLACKLVLSACYLGIIAAALVGVPGMQPAVLIVTHVGALAVVWIAGAKVDGSDRDAVVRYYMLIWKLFYLEFAAIPLAALLGS